MISALTGAKMWVADDQVKAHLAAGDKFAADDSKARKAGAVRIKPKPVETIETIPGEVKQLMERTAGKNTDKKPSKKSAAKKPEAEKAAVVAADESEGEW